MRHATTIEVLNPLIELGARRDGQGEVIEPDAKLGELPVLARVMLDQTERESPGQMHHVAHRAAAWRWRSEEMAAASDLPGRCGSDGSYSNRHIAQLAAWLLFWALEHGPLLT